MDIKKIIEELNSYCEINRDKLFVELVKNRLSENLKSYEKFAEGDMNYITSRQNMSTVKTAKRVLK